MVRGIEVIVTPREICEFYNVPYYSSDFFESTNLDYFINIDMDNIVNYLTKEKGEGKHRPDINASTSFTPTIMFPIAKIWMQFLCTPISHSLNVSTVNTFQAVQLYTILQKKH
ncbi:hypothetical protein J1N35_043712, partial [Gossypium stocksii]